MSESTQSWDGGGEIESRGATPSRSQAGADLKQAVPSLAATVSSTLEDVAPGRAARSHSLRTAVSPGSKSAANTNNNRNAEERSDFCAIGASLGREVPILSPECRRGKRQPEARCSRRRECVPEPTGPPYSTRMLCRRAVKFASCSVTASDFPSILKK